MTRPEKSSLVSTYWMMTEGYRKPLARGALAMAAVNLLELVPPILLGMLIDCVSGKRVSWPPLGLALVYIAVLGLQSVLRFPLRSGFLGTSIAIAADVRERYAGRVLRASRSSLSAYSSGDLMSRVNSDLGLVEGALSSGLPFLFDCSIYLLLLPGIMIAECPRLAVPVFAALAVVPIVATFLIPRISRASEATQKAFSQLVSKARENAVSAQTIRAYGLEGREGESFAATGAEMVERDLDRARLEALFSGSVQAMIALSMAVVLGLGSRLAIKGDLSAGKFVTFFQYAGMMAWPLTGLSWAFLLFRKGTVGLRRLEEILSLPEEASGGCSAPEELGKIEIRDLTFSHPGGPSPVLLGVSLSIRPRERIALVGPPGSGKTTLLHLLARLNEPPAGSVWMDGVDVTSINLPEFRQRISVTPEEGFLFSGTIRENLEMTATAPELVDEAARAARVEGAEFGEGLETPVGEKGTALSGGQRQRVAIARAVARPARLLLLDDATSALDRETEARVFGSLGLRTVIFSTHRMSLARRADRVLVLDRGRIVEQGPPEALLGAGGLFSRMARKESLTNTFDDV